MTVEVKICPCCGEDLTGDTPIIIGDFSMFSSTSQLCYRGETIHLTPAQRTICWILMKAHPRPIGHDVLLNRLDSDASTNVVDVYMCRMRQALAAAGAPDPFEAVRSMRFSGNARAHMWRAV